MGLLPVNERSQGQHVAEKNGNTEAMRVCPISRTWCAIYH